MRQAWMNLNVWTRLATITDRQLGMVAGIPLILTVMQVPYEIVTVVLSLFVLACSLVLAARLRVYGPEPGKKGFRPQLAIFRSPVFPLVLGALPLVVSTGLWQFLAVGLVLAGLWLQWSA